MRGGWLLEGKLGEVAEPPLHLPRREPRARHAEDGRDNRDARGAREHAGRRRYSAADRRRAAAERRDAAARRDEAARHRRRGEAGGDADRNAAHHRHAGERRNFLEATAEGAAAVVGAAVGVARRLPLLLVEGAEVTGQCRLVRRHPRPRHAERARAVGEQHAQSRIVAARDACDEQRVQAASRAPASAGSSDSGFAAASSPCASWQSGPSTSSVSGGAFRRVRSCCRTLSLCAPPQPARRRPRRIARRNWSDVRSRSGTLARNAAPSSGWAAGSGREWTAVF